MAENVNVGMSGLDAANLVTEAAGAEQTMQTPQAQTSGALIAPQKTKGSMPVINAGQLNPTETAELLARMQEMIDSRTGGWHNFMSGMQDTLALATPPRLGGPTDAMAKREELKRQEQSDIFNMRAQMANIQSGQRIAQQRGQNMTNTLANLSGNAGVGQGYDQNILNQVQNLYSTGKADEGDKLLQSHMQDIAKINRTARTGKDYYSKSIEIETPNGIEYVSPAMIDEMNLKPTAKGRAQLQIMRETPTDSGAGAFGSIVSNMIDKREGGYKASDGNTGAPVNFGINQKYNPDVDVKNITKEDAKRLYKERYWDPIGADKLNQDAAAVAFDAAVNQGVDYANKLIKQTGGDAQAMMDQRRADYAKGTSNPGWANRLNSLEKELSYTQTTAPRRPTINAPISAASRAEAAAQEAGGKEYATQVGKSHATTAAGIDESYNTSGNRLNLQKSSLTLLDDPDVRKLVGYLDKPGVGATILRQVRDGITFGRLGDINLKDFDANLAKTGATQAEIDKFNKLINNLRVDEAQEARAAFKGQGAVSDMERKLIAGIVGNISNSAESVKAAVKWRLERAQFDNEMGRAFNEYRNKFGDTASFGKFMRTDGQRVIDAHNDRLASTLGIDRAQLEGNRGYETGGSSTAAPTDAQALVDKYKTRK